MLLNMLPYQDSALCTKLTCFHLQHINRMVPILMWLKKGVVFSTSIFPSVLLLVRQLCLLERNINITHYIIFQIVCMNMQLVDHTNHVLCREDACWYYALPKNILADLLSYFIPFQSLWITCLQSLWITFFLTERESLNNLRGWDMHLILLSTKACRLSCSWALKSRIKFYEIKSLMQHWPNHTYRQKLKTLIYTTLNILLILPYFSFLKTLCLFDTF